MEYEAFKIELKRRLKDYLEPDTEVCFNTIEKNNKCRKETITFEGIIRNMIPAIHLKELYEDFLKDEDMGRILDIVLKMLQRKINVNSRNIVKEWDKTKEQIQIKLINYEWNQEMLCDVPHRKYLDLAVVFQIKLYEESHSAATILIDNNIMRSWGITENELYNCAYQNLMCEEYTIKGMGQIISKMLDGEEAEEKEDENMYVMTNESGCFGAAGLLRDDLLKEFADRIQGSFYILPSSVHEIIFVKDSQKLSVEEFGEMVTEINESQVECQDRLSNLSYYFQMESGRIVF